MYNGIVHYKIGDFMRRIRRKKEKQKKKIIIISTFLFLIIMTSGYAAFSTNITLRAKGNIKERPQDESCFTYYDNGDGTLTVSGYDVEKCGTDVNIPEKINGLSVTKIGSGAWQTNKGFSKLGLTSVVIPDTVTTIGAFAFYGNNVSKLKLGDGVKKIGGEAFNLNDLTELVLSDGLEYLDNEAFAQNKLTHAELPKSLTYMGGGVFNRNNFPEDNPMVYGVDENGNTDYTVLDSYARNELNNYVIPSTVKTIAHRAFRGVRINGLTIPSNVEMLNSQAFNSAVINSIMIEDGLKNIISSDSYGGGTFKETVFNCELTLPSTVEHIDVNTFNGSNIKTINIKKGEGSIIGEPWGASRAKVN